MKQKKTMMLNQQSPKTPYLLHRHHYQRNPEMLALDSTYSFIDPADFRSNFDPLNTTAPQRFNICKPSRTKSASRRTSYQRRHYQIDSPESKSSNSSSNKKNERAKSRHFQLELQRWILDKQQILNQIYGTSNKKDLERIYGIKIPSRAYVRESSLYVLQNEGSIVLDGLKNRRPSLSKFNSKDTKPEYLYAKSNIPNITLSPEKEVKQTEPIKKTFEDVDYKLSNEETFHTLDFSQIPTSQASLDVQKAHSSKLQIARKSPARMVLETPSTIKEEQSTQKITSEKTLSQENELIRSAFLDSFGSIPFKSGRSQSTD